MQLEQIAEFAIERLFGRMVRRALIALAFALCAIVALYQFTVAGLLALQAPYGMLQARLIVGAVFAVLALAALAALWLQRWAKGARAADKTVALPREMQFVMLMEAAMLGYDLARKRDPAHRAH
jgi:hypothetical protein